MEDSLLAAMSGLAQEMRVVRRDIHRHPELAFNERRTSALVAERLRAWGVTVHDGIGKTGLVGVLSAGTSDRAMDCEPTWTPYRSMKPRARRTQAFIRAFLIAVVTMATRPCCFVPLDTWHRRAGSMVAFT